MTEIYNKYIRSPYYDSDIVFINSKTPILERRLYWVKYENDDISKSYLDYNKYLQTLYWDSKNNGISILSATDGLIEDVQPVTKCYSYIRIIRDNYHPELEGDIMILMYGYRIKTIIKDYWGDKDNDSFEHLFNFNKYMSTGYGNFPNYDKSKFYKTKASETDMLLDIESEINFKTVQLPLKLSRKQKLELINSKNK